MSRCHGSVPQDVRPGSARVLVTELSGSGHINPTPAVKACDNPESAGDPFYLSPERLELLCGTGDLSQVTSLEICVDTKEYTLGNFGAYLPRLVQLKMNDSMIMSVRDLGTTLSHLQVLWMPRCSLQDLDGISTLSSIKELYLAYNRVSDLSQIGMLENLQLIDLEGNDVDDLVQVQYLGLCDKLQTLTLEGNPVCVRPNPTAIQTADYSYRAAVRELVPQLRYLDDSGVEEDGHCGSSSLGEDWVILRNSIRDGNSSQAAPEDEETTDGPCSRAASARLPHSSHSFVWPLSLVGSRPHTGSRPMTTIRPGVLSPPGSRPGSADSDLATVAAETSVLTHGAGKILFCGNPVQALRARREKLKTAPTKSTFTPRDLPIHVPEHTYDLEEPEVGERADVFAELRAWREQHSRRLQAIEAERLPQVLAIQHSAADKERDYDTEEDDFCGIGADSTDEEDEEENCCDSQSTASPDSSFQSLSPDFQHKEALSPDVARLSWSPDTLLCPSPPLRPTASTAHKLPGIRTRRLRINQTTSELSPDFSRVSQSAGRGSDQMSQWVQQVSLATHTPCPPPTRTLCERLTDSCAELDSSGVQSGRRHLQTPHMSKLQERPVIRRPHTAKAALQKHQPRHMLQPCRGSSQPNCHQSDSA